MTIAIEGKTATILGGTGFVGRQIVRELAGRGYSIKVATRAPERAYFLRPCGTVGQIVPLYCDYNDPKSIEKAVSGSDTVINCVGILYEKKKGGFMRAHKDLPQNIAKCAAKSAVKNFVHISSLGVHGNSQYGRSKLEGDKAVQKAFPDAVILRPSVIFGPDDQFFNMFAELARFLPALPLIGGGHTQFQPVYVGDVADAAVNAIDNQSAKGEIFALGGPEIVTFKEIYQRLFKYTGQKRALVPLPFSIAKIEAFFMSFLPKPLLTPDQVEALKSDTIVPEGAKGLHDLGVIQTSMDVVLPQYLSRFGKAQGMDIDHENENKAA